MARRLGCPARTVQSYVGGANVDIKTRKMTGESQKLTGEAVETHLKT